MQLAISLFLVTIEFAGLCLTLMLGRRGSAGVPGCRDHGDGCSPVLATRWSRVGPVPVAVAGSAAYVAIAVATIGASPWIPADPVIRAVFARTAVALAVACSGAAVWFALLQSFVIRRFCRYCNAVHLISLTIAATIFIAARAEPSGRTPALATPIVVGSSGVVLLIVGQLLLRPHLHHVAQTPEIRTITGDGPNGPAAGSTAAHAGASSNSTPARMIAPPSRFVRLLGGRLTLRAGDWPALGPQNAPRVVACLFDYTCGGCRTMRRQLAELVDRFGGDLAVLSVPVPQHPACNPDVRDLRPAAKHACEYARAAVEVWLRDPDGYAAFERWLFDAETLPDIGHAARRAASTSVIGRSSPTAADTDALLRRAVEVYRAAGTGNLPTLLLPKAVVTGLVPSTEVLMQVVTKELGAPPARSHIPGGIHV